MASGIIKSYTRPSGSYGEGAHWSFEWTSTKKSTGVSTVTWSLYTRGRSVSPTWLETGCWMSVSKNGTTTQLYAKEHTEGADCSFSDKFRASGSFDVRHEANGYASFTVNFEVYIYEYAHQKNSGMGVLDSLPSTPPTVTASVVDINSKTINLTGNSNVLVKYFSTAEATMTATAQSGASLDMDTYVITNGSNVEYGTEGVFYNVENPTFNFSVADNLGNIGRATETPTMVDYIKLTCLLGNNRPDGDGTMVVTCHGDFFNESFGAAQNNLVVEYRYRTQGGSYSGWKSMGFTLVADHYYASATITGLDYKLTYEFECRAEDSLMSVTSTSGMVKSIPVFHWSENDFVFEVPVIFNAGVEMPTAIGEDAEGVWTPYLNSAVVSSYTTQYGWYSKVNQAVTVGFIIKANCRSGYDSTTISIGGLPFAPMFSAAGGGMCSGAYVGGGFTFQCFVAETSGYISTRVQACNNTTATNLSTTASGCNYPYGGGVVTLSGTITYITSA